MTRKVDEYMKKVSGLMVTTDTNMVEVLRLMLQQKSSVVIVTDVNRMLQGIITGSDVVLHLERAIDSSTLKTGAAEHVMTRGVIGLPAGTSMLDAIEKMFRHRLHSIVITRGYEPVGLLTQLDIIRWWVDEHTK